MNPPTTPASDTTAKNQIRFSSTSFPNGWFRVANSEEVRPKEVKPLHYFGKDFVLFRTESGKPYVFDAHCPHLGAHLGYGGKVKGENIQCPFHGWCFDAGGQCNQIPYATKIPPKAQIQTWQVREINGMILVYYHARQEAPTWEIPVLKKYQSREWTPLRFGRRRKIRSHPQEIFENGMDIIHSLVVHPQQTDRIKAQELKIDNSVLTISLDRTYNLFLAAKMLGQKIRGADEITLHGLGVAVNRVLVEPMGFEYFYLFTVTPIDAEHIEIQSFLSMKKVYNPLATEFLVRKALKEGTKVIDRDIPIWENKAYSSNPLLSEGDGPIARYRLWASQFYQ